MRLWSFLLGVLLVQAIASVSVHAVDVNAQQLEILESIASELPALTNLASGAWVSAHMLAACTGPNVIYGVLSCDAEGWVDQLEVTGTFLGSIPPSISQMQGLRSFHASNSFGGTIPEGLFSLPKLIKLELPSNQLNGSLPSHWSSLAELVSVDLSYNQLEGNLPTIYPSSLKSINMANNKFSGTIPSGITTIANIILPVNQLTGPFPWQSIDQPLSSELTSLELDDNFDLVGSLPSFFFQLPKLQTFTASDTSINGELPQDASNCAELSILKIKNAEINGSLPSALGSCPLIFLELSNNLLTGPIPESLMSTISLNGIFLDSNQMSGELPLDWSALTGLEDLILFNNQFEGTLPSSMIELSNSSILTELHIENNNFDLCGNTALLNIPFSNELSCSVDNQLTAACGCVETWKKCLNFVGAEEQRCLPNAAPPSSLLPSTSPISTPSTFPNSPSNTPIIIITPPSVTSPTSNSSDAKRLIGSSLGLLLVNIFILLL